MAGPGSNIRCKAEAHVEEVFFSFFVAFRPNKKWRKLFIVGIFFAVIWQNLSGRYPAASGSSRGNLAKLASL